MPLSHKELLVTSSEKVNLGLREQKSQLKFLNSNVERYNRIMGCKMQGLHKWEGEIWILRRLHSLTKHFMKFNC